MKQIITEKRLKINQKGIKQYNIPSMINVVVLSNHDNPVILESDDRRYCVIRT